MVQKGEIEENEIDISVEDFCKRLNLEVLHKGSRKFMHISTFNVNRPGLQFAGYYQHFSSERIQVIGEMETTYLKTLDDVRRMRAVEELFRHDFPCLVISTVLDPAEELMICAEKYDRVPKLIWKDMYAFSSDSVLLCLASEHYDAEEYIRDYNTYIRIIRDREALIGNP